MKTTIHVGLLAGLCLGLGVNLRGAVSVQLLSERNPATAPVAPGNGDSGVPVLSPDGRLVLFASRADDLAVMTNGGRMATLIPPPLNVFLRDRTNGTTTLVSVDLSGTNGGNGDSLPAVLSPDGRYVLFESTASNLVAGDTNGVADVFLRDLVAGTTVAVSVSTNGDPGNGASRSAVMTPDGRYIAFVSAANNLVAGDTNGIPDVFLRDLQSGTTTLLSVGATPVSSTRLYASSDSPAITPDGRYVAFYSTATNLVPGATNAGEIYVRDVVAGSTIWASAYAPTMLPPVGNNTSLSFGHSISADGQFVTYEATRSYYASRPQVPISTSLGWGVILRYNTGSGATDVISSNAAVPVSGAEVAANPVMTPDGRFVAFVANVITGTATNSCIQVWDARSGTIGVVSVDLSGTTPTNAICDWPVITPDGRFVAFISNGTNFVTNALCGDLHLYLRDVQAASTLLMDAGTNGTGAGVAPVSAARLSDDGRFAAFEAPDGSLVPQDLNRSEDVFVRDVTGAATELVSRHAAAFPSDAGTGLNTLSALSLSQEGSFVAFVSEADNLVPNDGNGFRDVFVRDLLGDTTLLVSIDMWGVASGNGMSYDPAISGDSRYVVFTSLATNLVAGDANSLSDVFVRDLLADTTLLVSVNTNGVSGNGPSYSPMISADGRYVLFHSRASDLVPGITASGIENLFWRDLWSGTTYAITKYTSGPNSTLTATMTSSGRYVLLGSQGTTWFVWDSQALATVYTNATPSGSFLPGSISADGNHIAYVCSSGACFVDRSTNKTIVLGNASSQARSCFSADGRFLAYESTAPTVPPPNRLAEVFLYDCQTGSNTLVSQAFNAGGSANGSSHSPAISPDGRFVAYRSAASNLVPDDNNGVPDIFLWDRITGATLLVTINSSLSSSANNRSLAPVFSSDGRTLVFESWASDLVANDCNPGSDLFAFNVYASGPIPLLQAAIVPGAAPGQGVWITWPVIPGKSYVIQFKNSPADAAWQGLGGRVTIVGTQAYSYDLAPGTSQRFYRVVAQ